VTEFDQKCVEFQRAINMKDIEIKVLHNKNRLITEENVTIRLMLQDPRHIRRGPDD
jgi:hypothetical protein